MRIPASVVFPNHRHLRRITLVITMASFAGRIVNWVEQSVNKLIKNNVPQRDTARKPVI